MVAVEKVHELLCFHSALPELNEKESRLIALDERTAILFLLVEDAVSELGEDCPFQKVPLFWSRINLDAGHTVSRSDDFKLSHVAPLGLGPGICWTPGPLASLSDGLTEEDALGLEEVPHDEGHLRGTAVEARTDEAADSLRLGAAENPLHEQAGLHLLLRALLTLHQSEHGLVAADMALGSHLVGETLLGLKSDQPHLGLLDVLFGLLPLGGGLGLLALRDDFVLLVLHAALAFLAGWVWVLLSQPSDRVFFKNPLRRADSSRLLPALHG